MERYRAGLAIVLDYLIKLSALFSDKGRISTKALSAEGIKCNVTLVFSANQALLAARAGAAYVSYSLIGQRMFCHLHQHLIWYHNPKDPQWENRDRFMSWPPLPLCACIQDVPASGNPSDENSSDLPL